MGILDSNFYLQRFQSWLCIFVRHGGWKIRLVLDENRCTCIQKGDTHVKFEKT